MSMPGPFDVSDERKASLLRRLGVLESIRKERVASLALDQLLLAARVHCISKSELYFLQDASELRQPLNLRNEAAAVSLLLAYFSEAAAADGGSTAGLLSSLVEYSKTLWPELADGDLTISSSTDAGSSGSAGTGAGAAQAPALPPHGQPAPAGSPAADFEAWAREQGVQSAITIATFAGGLRGCAASRDVEPGETVLSIPADVLIYEDTVKQTDLGRMLHAIPDLTIDNLLIIFTMIDRHDEDSKWARYWRSLPDKYYTGLSYPDELVESLAGTAAHLELRRAQQHLRQQYAATRPLFDMLLKAYPQFLKPEWFGYDSYLWAAELWYGYAFEVEFPEHGGSSSGSSSSSSASQPAASSGGGGKGKAKGKGGKGRPKPASSSAAAASQRAAAAAAAGGSSKPVMVPFACHINHSPWPHCVRYGRVNPQTRTLDYPAFRPCQEGQQVFISYGPVPNLKLLCYYGFVVDNNPHDLVLLTLEPPEGPLRQAQLALLGTLGLSMEHNLQDGPLSKQLLACLRVIVGTVEELQRVKKGRADPREGPINGENEGQALCTLQAALEGMLQPLQRLPLLAGGSGGGGGGGGDRDAEGQCGGAAAAEAAEQQQQPAVAAGAAGGAQQEEAAAAAAQAPAAAADPEQQQQQQEEADSQPRYLNENGFDADWQMSRHFCRLYLEGQRRILQRSLEECRKLLAALEA